MVNRCQHISCIRVNDLEDLERLYHHIECQCELCRKGDAVEMNREDILVDKSSGFTMFFSGEELDRKAAERVVDRLAKHYLGNLPKQFKTYQEALEAVLIRHPKLAARYLNRPVVDDGRGVD